MGEHEVHNIDCERFLDSWTGPKVPLLFMDPPDNIGLVYDEYNDKRPADDYYRWLELLVRKSFNVADTIWLSYYWEHDMEIKMRLQRFLKLERPSVKAKTFIWRYTFGQYVDSDCGSGFRFLLRLTTLKSKIRPDNIRVPSKRMEIGDSRAAGPRVPDDAWEFPRVTGNSGERRSWHNTQHPEALMRRLILISTDRGDRMIDLFGGTGTSIRASEQTGRKATVTEISKQYCHRIAKENPGTRLVDYPVT